MFQSRAKKQQALLQEQCRLNILGERGSLFEATKRERERKKETGSIMPHDSSSITVTPWRQDMNSCPCPEEIHRRLSDSTNSTEDGDATTEPLVLWEVIYTCFVLVFMLIALLSDRIGADGVMLTALTLFMASSIITVEEGLEGFSNEGLMSVMVLFVVAQGISVTGALDWYMGKLLGRPNTIAGAQVRLMIPIAIISAFLNNTPVVAVMIPIVQRWGKNIGVSPQQLLIPLSFASILGGTCTLIGTSTNLIVVGLLEKRYPDDDSLRIGLFDLSEYGIPVAIVGMTYILAASPFLLPGASSKGGGDILQDSEDVLLGARLTDWSPAAGRSVKRSGLRDSGGIFLVSVERAATGNVHRAVGQDFVLNAGDVLFFTGLVESFGEFCEEHGLEVITNETAELLRVKPDQEKAAANDEDQLMKMSDHNLNLATVQEDEVGEIQIPVEIGITAASLRVADETDRMRSINQIVDQIRGTPREEDAVLTTSLPGKLTPRKQRRLSVGMQPSDPAQIVVTTDVHDSHRLVLIGINAHDRAGLMLDISKGLLRLNLQLRHTEASVVGERSLSIWRCEFLKESDLPDLEEVWSVLNALLESEGGIEAVKTRGLRVIRAEVTKYSRLVVKTAAEVDFRQTYKAAIVAVQKGGKNTATSVKFDVGDVLILQARDSSPLLKEPPEDFYDKVDAESKPAKSSSGLNLVKLVKTRFSASDLKALDPLHVFTSNEQSNQVDSPKSIETANDEFFIPGEEQGDEEQASSAAGADDWDASQVSELDETHGSVMFDAGLQDAAWRDLRVLSSSSDPTKSTVEAGAHQREFLTAMEVAPDSAFVKKTVVKSGLTKLAGVFLVSIERPTVNTNEDERQARHHMFSVAASDQASSVAGSIGVSSFRNLEQKFVSVAPDEPLQVGDVLWFSGSASAVGDLRKIPGLRAFDSDQVDKVDEKIYDRRLVQAVIARKGPLVGKTVRDVRFRTKYGAAVISVHREGKRVHDHPGQIKLHAGDVLLLEAGPTFIERQTENDRSFALLAEVQNSAPPRLGKLIPAIFLTVAMLAVYTAGVASLVVCALVASITMVAIGIMSQQEARDALNWEVYVTIASAFGIGSALVNSGVAGAMATFLVAVGESLGIGDAGLYGAVYLATFLISNIVTNNAAAALLFPIAMDAAEQTGADILIMSYTLMLAASASFMSPFGYQTNLMIYGPGGYKFKDFLYIGSPMQIILWIFSIVILTSTKFDFWVSWLICAAVFVIVAAVRLTNGRIGKQMSDQLMTTLSPSASGEPAEANS